MNDIENKKERLARQLATVVCICKGINLGKFISALKNCKTVEEVNQQVGSGTGDCEGKRCGPRIKWLLENLNIKKS